MSEPTAPTYVCVGSIFIDDIVFPDGRTVMGVLGGAGTHAAAGVCVWGERPGLVCYAGKGMPPAAQAQMDRDFDMRGVLPIDIPQGRAWQIFEWDNRRIEIFRVDNIDPFAYEPQPDKLTPIFFEAQAFTVLRGAENFAKWRAAMPNKLLLWEPDSLYMEPRNRASYLATLPQADVVSPNLLESQTILEIKDAETIVRMMLDNGAKIAALRMGERGSLLGKQGQRELIHVPPVPVPEVVDQTGAGNSFCGGFLVGWHRTGDLRTAGCYGAVSASFTLEQMGLADPTRVDLEVERAKRLEWALANVG